MSVKLDVDILFYHSISLKNVINIKILDRMYSET